MSNNKHTLITVIITALIFANFGFFINYILMKPGNKVKTVEKCDNPLQGSSFQDGWKAAEERLFEIGYLLPEMKEEEYKQVRGSVQELSPEKIVLKIVPSYPLDDPKLDIREVIINPETKIFIQKEKDMELYNKEIEEYEGKVAEIQKLETAMQESQTTSTPIDYPDFPEPFEKIATDFSDLKEGMNVEVYSDEVLNNKKEFNATKIVFDEIFEN